ncbi:hypothetical protein KP509_14G086100 [Ceratopteris richardii]|uniref:Mitochondrial adenine nucleotide transporter BTL3 n=1 Tax=Ceratopteris richardii TaxID=49495 RepID=A0A8T2TDX1_CERRI|nr:hypothetical protein KP509_14G086100 [Ceratopteris richardii]
MKETNRKVPLVGMDFQQSLEISTCCGLDEGHCFPSLFLSPFKKTSICSFLLAMPQISQQSSSVALPSFSTLAFLSMSFSIKPRNVASRLDVQDQSTPVSLLVDAVSGALRFLHTHGNSSERNEMKRRNVFPTSVRSIKRDAFGRPVVDTSAGDSKEHLQGASDSYGLGSGVVNGCGSEECCQQQQHKSEERVKEEKRAEKLRNISKYLLAGAISTIVARTSVAPLERLKLEYIVGGSKHNWFKVIHRIWVTEGLAGFWKGNMLNLLRMVPFKSINFLTYDMICRELLERQGKEEVTNFDRLLAGAASGAAATFICIPLDTVRTRLIAPGGDALGGMFGCIHQMVQKEGFWSLYKGLLPTLLSMVPAGAVFYGVYDILKVSYLQSPKAQKEYLKQIKEKLEGATVADPSAKVNPQLELGPVRTLIYGAIAGAFSETVTYPLEVVRRQLQLHQSTTKLGLRAAFQTIVQRDGFGALFSGIVPSTVQVLPSAALSYLVYEFMKTTLKLS